MRHLGRHEPEDEARLDECGESRPLRLFPKAQRDPDVPARCSKCRARRIIDDPGEPPSRVLASSLSFPIDDSWRHRMAAGTVFKVAVVLHVDCAEQTDAGETRWRARWLEVTRLDD